MKTRNRPLKFTPSYSILSLREIRELLRIAEADAVGRYGANPSDSATVVIRSRSTRYEGETQVWLESAAGHPLFVSE